MSLMGLDVGTTGCKAAVFCESGELLAQAYREYDTRRPEPGWAELDSEEVWRKVQDTIAQAAAETKNADPVEALAVSSMGEALVPASAERQILGPSILNFDARGHEFLNDLPALRDPARLYALNGNLPGNHYSLTKLLWIKKHRPDVYDRADYFLLWGGFVPYMLGGRPAVDYTLANRTLLFDLDRQDWSADLIEQAGLDAAKLPPVVPTGASLGRIAPAMAEQLGLGPDVLLVAGPHDQCANALGCGVVEPGDAMYGMGTVICMVPVFLQRPEAPAMMAQGLNTEHHALNDRYVSFIYNLGGALLKWYRDTFAAQEAAQAARQGRSPYPELLAEMPEGPSGLVALPHFGPTGPPDFIPDAAGAIAGLHTDTTRGQVLKALLEGATFYLRECLDRLPQAGISIRSLRATGGGSRSPRWVQLSADILGKPMRRTREPEAGALGAAMLAGVAASRFRDLSQAVEAMVHLEDREFAPRGDMAEQYSQQLERYRDLWQTLEPFLRAQP